MNRNAIRLTILLNFVVIFGAIGQNPDKTAKKADKYYQLGQYATAIPLYSEALDDKLNATWMYKLANCYRLTNKTEEAHVSFQKLFESDILFKIKQLNLKNNVFIEAESSKIGELQIPQMLFKIMKKAPIIEFKRSYHSNCQETCFNNTNNSSHL